MPIRTAPSIVRIDAGNTETPVVARPRTYAITDANGQSYSVRMPSHNAITDTLRGWDPQRRCVLNNVVIANNDGQRVIANDVVLTRPTPRRVRVEAPNTMIADAIRASIRSEQVRDLSALFQSAESLNWTENFTEFQAAYDEAREREHPVFRPDGMLGNFHNLYGTPEHPTRSFGLEIEVDFPDSNDWGSEQYALASALYTAGLAQDSEFNRWHTAARRHNLDGTVGYTRSRNAWSVEFDRSVDDCNGHRGAEIISPVMVDVPGGTYSVWEDVKTVVEQISNLGGRPTMRNGLHINIGGANVDATAMMNLVKIWAHFDDLMVRLAHTSEIGRNHRGRGYCLPIDYSDTRTYYLTQAMCGHTSAINLTHLDVHNAAALPANSPSRIEFRIFDSTLDAGRIQFYTTLCMAMVAAAIRGVGMEDFTPEQGGSHVRARGGPARRLSGDAWKSDTVRVREFIDFLALPREVAEDALTCYAKSRWMTA